MYHLLPVDGSARIKVATVRALTALVVALLLGVTTACGDDAISGSRSHAPASTASPSTQASTDSRFHAAGFAPNLQAKPAPAMPVPSNLPSAIDLSAYNPPVGAQYDLNSCTAWATGYYLRSWYAKRDGYSPYGGFQPIYTYSQIVQSGTDSTTFAQNLDIQQQQGIDTLADDPLAVDELTPPTDAQRTNAARYKIAGYTDVRNTGDINLFQGWIRTTLASGNPIAIGFPIYPEFEHAAQTNGYVAAPTPGETSSGGHATFAYGYDLKGLWIENQWGDQWGNQGFGVLSWDFVNRFALEAVSITPPTVPPRWQQLPGTATDISVGASGSVWAIGANPAYGGYGIYHWNPRTWTWNAVDGGAVRIAVDPVGNAWVVNSFGNIFRWTGSAWQSVPGAARDIGIGVNGYVWVVGWSPRDDLCRPSPCDGGIYLYNGLGWQQTSGAANRISVDASGKPWIVTGSGAIYRWIGGDWTGNQWQQLPGAASDIGCSARECWVIGMDSGVYYVDVSVQGGVEVDHWVAISGSGVVITSGPSGNAWVANSAGSIFEHIALQDQFA